MGRKLGFYWFYRIVCMIVDKFIFVCMVKFSFRFFICNILCVVIVYYRGDLFISYRYLYKKLEIIVKNLMYIC